MAAESDQVGIGLQRLRGGRDAGKPIAVADQAAQRRVESKGHAALDGERGEALRELEAVAGLVAGQEQPADELVAHVRKRRLVPDAASAIEQFESDAAFAQDGDVVRAAVELLLRAKELQRALHALVVGDAGRST